jgi:hypothetical protein
VLVVLAGILPFLLFTLAFDYWVINTASHPATIKKIVADSGVYTTFTQSALKQADAQAGGRDVVSLVDPAVKNLAMQTLTPQFLQQTSENIIDGIYHWLDGKVAQPDFKIDLASKKADLARLVADHAKQQATQLPLCPRGTPVPDLSTFDVFSATCLPRIVTPDMISNQVEQALLNNKDFLSQPVLTAGTLKDKTGQPLFASDKVKQVPHYYQLAKHTPIILTILAILTLTGIIFLSPTRQQGLHRAGMVLLIIGVIMLVFAYWLGHYDVQNKLDFTSKNGVNNQEIVKNLRNVIKDLTDLVNKNYWFFGGLYAALGVGAVAGAAIYRRKSLVAESGPRPAGKPTKVSDRRSASGL